jgi:hypothetical protein
MGIQPATTVQQSKVEARGYVASRPASR